MDFDSPYLSLLQNRINLQRIPFSERGSRLLLFHDGRQFAIRMAERWFKRDPRLSAYRERPPIIDGWVFTDAEGEALELELTTYPHCIECRTRLGMFTITFLDAETLLVMLPSARCGLRFGANLDYASTDRRGGILRLSGDIRRNIAYTTNATILSDEKESPTAASQVVRLRVDATQGGQAFLLNITPRLGFNRYLPSPEVALENAARRWHDWFAAAPPVEEKYRPQYYYAWWVMRAGLISTRFYTTREAMTPSKVHYVGIWQWDACFHALAYRHVDRRLAQDQLRILLDHQREDGMLPDAVHDEGLITHLSSPVDADVTKPPLLAWAAWKLYETDGDREFLQEIYEPVVRWNNWWFENNSPSGNGLCAYRHPFTSGLDDSPLWDEGMPVESPDLNTYLCLQQEALSRIAAAIGQSGEAACWKERADDLAARMLEWMWDAQTGLFWAYKRDAVPPRRIPARTPFNLFPLLTARMPEQVVARLLSHLTDVREFWPRYPVPTVALDDPHFDPQQMWRGPTWININYLLIEGLQRTGHHDLAVELRRRTLELVCNRDDIYEYYHPESGTNPPKAAPIFGWSAAAFIDLAIQAAASDSLASARE
jgi:putative isomerase